MAKKYQAHDRPIPGYQLLKFLGRGGFGQVWEATGPGGVKVALKIIDMEGGEGLKEFRGIRLFKNIHHPNLAPIIGVWLRDEAGNLIEEDPLAGSDGTESINLRSLRASEMILAMGLGEKNLLDLLRDYQAKGQKGIPVNELLDYMEGAARAIDFLNSPRHDLGSGPVAIQHGDIKPQNILIVGDAAQVCDFGLARALGGGRASRATAASFTAAYAAPELLTENKPSRSSDQYALAISYVELRTGELPFNTNFPAAILYAHTQGKLDLSRLSPAEQPIIRKATSLRPEDRFPSCLDMVRELRRVLQGTAGPAVATVPPPPPVEKRYGGLPAEGKEIVPGYILQRPLGKGSFGEVWEAKAPGGKLVAIKIIRNLEAPSGRQEFKALEMIKGVDHNHLMELHAYWLIDSQGQIISDAQREGPNPPKAMTLVIACKLAKKHLGQRLKECLAENGQGIPLPELLTYLWQAAEALDYLNTPQHRLGDKVVAIQHRDIKPENILLADGTVKVADFGLAKVLEDTAAIVHAESAGLTLAYAAPELFRGRVTQWTDQYALAITYYQLRTGVLPFQATGTTNDIVRIHLEGRLDFSRVSPGEARVLRKATSVVPEERFPCCLDFHAALVEACVDLPELAAVSGLSGVLRYGGSSQRLRQAPAASSPQGRSVTPSAHTVPQNPGTVPAIHPDSKTVPAPHLRPVSWSESPAAESAVAPPLASPHRTTPNEAAAATVPGALPGGQPPAASARAAHSAGESPEEAQSLAIHATTAESPSTILGRRRWQQGQARAAVSAGGSRSGWKLMPALLLLLSTGVGLGSLFFLKPEWFRPSAQTITKPSDTIPEVDSAVARFVEQERWADAAAALTSLPSDLQARWAEQVRQGWLKQANAAFVASDYSGVEKICGEILTYFPDFSAAAKLRSDVTARRAEEQAAKERHLESLKPPAILSSYLQVSKATAWADVRAACATARTHPKAGEFKRLIALIDLEASVEQLAPPLDPQAKDHLSKHIATLDAADFAEPFGCYVAALAQAALGASATAVDHLLAIPAAAWQATDSPLACPYRQERAAAVLDSALAAQLPWPPPPDLPGKTLFPDPSHAVRSAAAWRLLQQLRPLAAQAVPFRFLGTIADLENPRTDRAAARQAGEQLLADPALRPTELWPARVTLLVTLARQQDETPTGHAQAVAYYRSAWKQVSEAASDSPLRWFQVILGPALKLAQAIKPESLSGAARQDLGWLCAQAGELIDNHLYGVDWPMSEPRQFAVDAFTLALQFDPNNPHWYIGRAQARHFLKEKKTPQERHQVLQDIEADALKAKELNPDLPGGDHWLGYVRILQARDSLNLAERQRLTQQAIEHFEQALKRYDQLGQNAGAGARAALYTSLSATYLDLANNWQDADESARRRKQQEWLELALHWARKATESNPLYPEKAWLAVAHATEDFGLLLGDVSAYGRAIEAYGRVLAERGDEVEGLLGEGRARYRAQLALPPGRADFSQAEARLDQARRFGRDTFAEAEALHWLGLVAIKKGELRRGRNLLEESLRLAQRFARSVWEVKNLHELIQLALAQAEQLPPGSSEEASFFSEARRWHAEMARLAPALAQPVALRLLVSEAQRLDRAADYFALNNQPEQMHKATSRLERVAAELDQTGQRVQAAFWRARAWRHEKRFTDALQEINRVVADFRSPEESVPLALLLIERLVLYLRIEPQARPDIPTLRRHLDEARATVAVAIRRQELQSAERIWCHTVLGSSYWALRLSVPESELGPILEAGIAELRAAIAAENDETPLLQSRLVDLLWLQVNSKKYEDERNKEERRQLCQEALELLEKLRKHSLPSLRAKARQFDELAEKFKRLRGN